MFENGQWDLETAKLDDNRLTAAALGELGEWVSVKISKAELLTDKFDKKFLAIDYTTIECGRTFRMSYFREGTLIPFFGVLKIAKFNVDEVDKLVGKEMDLKLKTRTSRKDGKQYIDIDSYRPLTAIVGKKAITATPSQGEDVPF